MKKMKKLHLTTIYDIDNEDLRIFAEDFYHAVTLSQLQALIMNNYVDQQALENYNITSEEFKTALVVILTDRICSEYQDYLVLCGV